MKAARDVVESGTAFGVDFQTGAGIEKTLSARKCDDIEMKRFFPDN